eukprot:TRINITY_DN3176_c0_g1_i1.p1 TRINITY_DN3176_c0_g1~~TRINITY_DN3176_c0_g1_i1.p1  ORF type:complete len:449 (-),score=103.25 TRINITY_DN3176_c0_g1_i1:47-1393(-)
MSVFSNISNLGSVITEKSKSLQHSVMRYPEAEVWVREATTAAKGLIPHDLMVKIAQATRSSSQCNIIMSILWKRLMDFEVYLHVWKALLLLDYLVKNGDDRVVQICSHRIMDIKSLTKFYYRNSDNEDVGVSVRERTKQLISLLDDPQRLRDERRAARENRGKFGSSVSSDTYYRQGRRRSNRSSGRTRNSASNRSRNVGRSSRSNRDSFESEERERERYRRDLRGEKEPDNAGSESEEDQWDPFGEFQKPEAPKEAPKSDPLLNFITGPVPNLGTPNPSPNPNNNPLGINPLVGNTNPYPAPAPAPAPAANLFGNPSNNPLGINTLVGNPNPAPAPAPAANLFGMVNPNSNPTTVPAMAPSNNLFGMVNPNSSPNPVPAAVSSSNTSDPFGLVKPTPANNNGGNTPSNETPSDPWANPHLFDLGSSTLGELNKKPTNTNTYNNSIFV